MKNFMDLVYERGISVSELADWCMISRQLVYKYICGDVDPNKISYINIVHLASYIGVSENEVYNSICESYKSKRIWCDTLKKWVLPEEIIEKVR